MSARNDDNGTSATDRDARETHGSCPAPPRPTEHSCDVAKTLSLIGMILGIGGMSYPLGVSMGLPFSVTAIVLGFIARKREPRAREFWLTAIITGFIGIGASIALYVSWTRF